MLNPKRYSISNIDGSLEEDHDGNVVYYDDFLNVMAVAIESQANHEITKAQLPDLKKALVDILVLAAQSKDPQAQAIKALASKALSQ